MTNVTVTDLHGLADELGLIRAQMADLKSRESEIRDMFIDAGIDHLEDDKFRAVVVHSMRKQVDWKAVAEKLKPSRQLLTAHTKHRDVTTIRVNARRGS